MSSTEVLHDTFNETVRDAIVLHGAAGKNILHMQEATSRLYEQHPIHAVDINPEVEIPHHQLHLIDKPEGQESLDQLFDSGAVNTEYISLVPNLHLPKIIEGLGRVAAGKVNFIVVAKPAVQSVAEMRVIDEEVRSIKELRAQGDADYDPSRDQFLFVHEHYKEKGAWHELRKNFGEVANRLGRLQTLEFHIRESRTAEEEGRVAAFGGGAIEDLAPHVMSLGLDIAKKLYGEASRYTINDCHPEQNTTVKTFHYKLRDSHIPEELKNNQLSDDTDTGFKIDIDTKVHDKLEGTDHDLHIQWVAGKGLSEDRKEAWMEFVSPEGMHNAVRVDFKNNTLELPESVADLFEGVTREEDSGKYIAQYDDDGYNYVVERGLNGGNPRESFQSWDEARVVTKWLQIIRRKQPQVIKYALGDLPEELR